MSKRFISPILRDYLLIVLIILVLGADFLFQGIRFILFSVALIGALPTVRSALRSLMQRRISIDMFNLTGLALSFITMEIRPAAFIVLMLTFARLLNSYTGSRARQAIEELLKLKPPKTIREQNGQLREIPVDNVKEGDIIVVKSGSRIPIDGIVVFGNALVNESSVSGESIPIQRIVGDNVLSSTLIESGVLKIQAKKVGKDSTIEQIVALMREAAKHKSPPEKLADKFASIFLPILAVGGIITYLVTHNTSMTISLFLVACADDMAVAIPLAITASLGKAAKRGVIIKGGEWLEVLGRTKILIFDKTGTITYGKLTIHDVHIEPGITEDNFWRFVAIAEKFSEHPIGKAVFRKAAESFPQVPNPDEFYVHKGSGIIVRYGKEKIVIGNESILSELGIPLTDELKTKIKKERLGHRQTTFLVFLNNKFAGLITVADVPRAEANESIKTLKNIGIKRTIMFTGDNEEVATEISKMLGIEEFYASMTPEEKLRKLEELEKNGPVGMVGDGINDAPALARADVGIAMGAGGTAVAIEAADIIITTDNLSRISDMMILSKKTSSIIRSDMVLWLFSNLIGFTLVFTGIAGPAFAAFYNFIADFFPLFNSSRLFRD